MRDFASFIGVDLGGGKGKTTAVARLVAHEGGARVVEVGARHEGRPWYDDVLVEYLRAQAAGAVAAIDAPLTLTACVRCPLPACPGLRTCVDPSVVWFRDKGVPLLVAAGRVPNGKPLTTPYTQRASEVWLQARHGIMPRETLGQGMGPLTARARYLTRALAGQYRLNENLLEVYPKATLHQLFGAKAAARYRRRPDTWRTRALMLERLAHELTFDVWREACLESDHCFDAVVCAYTAFRWVRDGWQLPALDRAVFEADGWIWFPPEGCAE